MKSIKRKLFLSIFAQTPDQTPDQSTEEDKIVGDPTNFSLLSLYPTLPIGWDPNEINILDNTISILNKAIFYLSNGHSDYYKLKTGNFTYDSSSFTDEQSRFCAELAKWIHENLFNEGNPFINKIKEESKKELVLKLKNSSPFVKLMPAGINQLVYSKLGGSLKDLLLNNFNRL